MSALFRATRPADFDGLYRRHAPSVYRYAYAVLGNHADAEDVTQQTFLNAYRALAQGTRPRKAENWLFTIAHNEVRRHFRQTQGKPSEVELDDRFPHPAPERSEPSLADVLRALRHLPPTQREALVMREFEGRSYAEIAQIMDVTQRALEGLLFRARRALAEHLEGALTCTQAEQALSRRLDGRLPRRAARALKAHLHECPFCVRFADVQKRQRSLLKGLSVMPIPASLFLFRGEPTAAAVGLGAGAATTGGSAAVGLGGSAAGAGATGVAAGLVAKAAGVTAAAALAGGVGYGVVTNPEAVNKTERKVTRAAAVEQTRQGMRAADVEAAFARGDQPGPARPASAPAKRKARKTKSPPAKVAVKQVEKGEQAERTAKRVARTGRKAARFEERPTTPAATRLKAQRMRARPEVGKGTGRIERDRPQARGPKPARPARTDEKPKPPRSADPPAPPSAAGGHGPKKNDR